MTVSVAIAGASGYAGGELLRLLAAHPHVNVGALTAHSSAGQTVASAHPHLATLAGRKFVETTAETLRGHDVVFLALPHGASAQVAALLDPEVLVLDCGADFRLEDPAAWQQYYGGEHAGTWEYGMPELIRAQGPSQRARLAKARRIAVPGCNVTAVTFAMQPGVGSEPALASDQIVAVLANGYSGAGKALKTHLLAAEALGAASPYAVGGSHRHIPEIEQNLRNAGAQQPRLSFTPTLVPMARGILATVTAPLIGDPKLVREKWQSAYGGEKFINLLPEGTWPTTAATLGANTAQVQVVVDEHAQTVIAICAIDNLGKGTAGAAIQSMNLALGFAEDAGLSVNGVAP